MRVAKLKLTSIAIVIGLAGCGGEDTTGPSTIPSGIWKLGTLQRADWSVVAISDPDLFTAEFADDGRLTVRADCNRCGASYESAGGSLSVGLMACTLAYCQSAPLDTQYASILQGAESFDSSGDTLTIRGPSGTLRFQR
jgi:heat shock protein HslJ